MIVGGLLLGAIYALFSSGLTLIWGMMNFINFAHGEFVMLGMYVSLLVVVWLGGGPAAFGFAAAFALFVLGVVVYLSLIRFVLRGPMLAQILSTFGLALLLRYTAFWIFSANFVSLPQTSLSGTINVGGILMPVPQLVAGVIAILLTIGLHLMLTRTTIGSQLLAVSEDRGAAMLMGIKPDRMQALAWGLSAGAAGIAGALMAIAYPWSPSVGETFGLTAFVVVALGGFGSVPGALFAGLIVGLDPGSLRVLVWTNLQGHRRLCVVRGVAVVAAAGPDGQSVNKIPALSPTVLLAAALLIYPLIFSGAFYLDIGVTFLLAAISASAWNIVGGYAGQVSVGHAMFFGLGAYAPLLCYKLYGWTPMAGIPFGIAASVALAILIGIPTFRLTGHYFSMATIAVAELIRIYFGTWDLVGAAIGLQGPATARGWWDLTFRSELPYYYIFLTVLAVLLSFTYLMERHRFGYYLRAIKAGERAARSLGVPVQKTKIRALVLSAVFTSIAGSLYSVKTGFIDPESGFGILVSVQMVIIAALGGAGRLYGPLIGALILIPLQTATNTWFGGGGTGLTFILYGGIIVLIARYEPGGIYDLWEQISPRRWRRKHAS